MKTIHIVIASIIGGLVTVPLSAFADATWNMGSGYNGNGPQTCSQTTAGSTVNSITNVGNAWTCTSTAPSGPAPGMTMNAWSSTGTNSSATALAAAQLSRYSYSTPNPAVYDFAVRNVAGSDQHSMDNVGYTDMIAMKFDQAVSLTQVSLGWTSTDADISVLRYKESGTPAAFPSSGVSLESLTTTGGWELVGHYANLQNDTIAPIKTADIDNAVASSWWLISAFNSAFGAGTTVHGGNTTSDEVTINGVTSKLLTASNDYVKLLAVAGKVSSSDVPEPAGIVLVGLGLLGLMASRRRITK